MELFILHSSCICIVVGLNYAVNMKDYKIADL